MLNQEIVLSALKAVKYPGYSRDIVSFGLVKNIAADSG
ncbi:MAG TPA: chromosome partitioning protein, partial [Methylomirabilota bacterium]|nr:chromosome partitioning protein [Methylomirabilota bacterium]